MTVQRCAGLKLHSDPACTPHVLEGTDICPPSTEFDAPVNEQARTHLPRIVFRQTPLQVICQPPPKQQVPRAFNG